jgi:hypothetical protein
VRSPVVGPSRCRGKHDFGTLDSALARAVEHLIGGQIVHLNGPIGTPPRPPLTNPTARNTGFELRSLIAKVAC